jgi:acetyl-CoA synthase
MGDELRRRCEEIGHPDLLDKIADERVATSPDELVAYLEEVGHPALAMDPMM